MSGLYERKLTKKRKFVNIEMQECKRSARLAVTKPEVGLLKSKAVRKSLACRIILRQCSVLQGVMSSSDAGCQRMCAEPCFGC